MHLRKWLGLGSVALGAGVAGLLVKSFLPSRLAVTEWPEERVETALPASSDWPEIEVTFLRCGTSLVPEAIAVRGAATLASYPIAHSAVLIRHPRATFLYDTGLCTEIARYVADESWLFRHTLGEFTLEVPLSWRLRSLGLQPSDLDFALLSHLHWDHVSGVPDLPGVRLLVNQVEVEAFRQKVLPRFQRRLVEKLWGENPLEVFECTGPPYEDFRASLDLFGDGSIVLVPLPGHSPGQVGMFINRAGGQRLFLIGDAAWVEPNYQIPATMHPLIWRAVTQDDATARQTLIDLRSYARRHPEVPLIAMHDARLQEAWMRVEGAAAREPLGRISNT